MLAEGVWEEPSSLALTIFSMRVAEDRCHVRSREWRRETCSGKSEGCAVTQLPAESGTSVMVSPPPRVMPVEDGVGAGQDEACGVQREPS